MQDISPPAPAWTEPLRRLARLSLDQAPHLCTTDLGCRDYHRAWTMLRLYESDGALPPGHAFLLRELADHARGHAPRPLRIMVSGAADTGQAALVLQVTQALGVVPDLVVVDICRTPLAQHEAFFAGKGLRAALVHADAVTVDVAPVDIILAHSFLAFVAPERRTALVANWARLLSPGGRVLVSERFSATPGLKTAWPDPGEREARRAALQARLVAEHLPAGDIAAMIEAADRLWDRTGQRSRMSDGQFRAALAAAGLALVRCDLSTVPQNVSPVQSKAAARERPRTLAVAMKP